MTNIDMEAGRGSMLDEVTPCCAFPCAYVALTPSVAVTTSCSFLCYHCLCGCCREAAEGCILCEEKIWASLAQCTLLKCAGKLCCLASACVFPCHKDVPCRFTCLYCSCGADGCGMCKKTNHGQVVAGVGGAPPTEGPSGAPSAEEIER